jgi:inhibitor of KinA
VLSLAQRLATPRTELLDIVPAYTTLTVWYDPTESTYEAVCNRLLTLSLEGNEDLSHLESREWVVPVRYEGPDLTSVAERTGLSIEEVITRHTERSYKVYLVGFIPGFPFLGELHPDLLLPRREKPRTRVPAGSVAIAGFQTGIYPLETPGGWHILGHTDIRPFDLAREPAVLFRTGDVVRFEALT